MVFQQTTTCSQSAVGTLRKKNSKLTTKTSGRLHCGVFIVNFENISLNVFLNDFEFVFVCWVYHALQAEYFIDKKAYACQVVVDKKCLIVIFINRLFFKSLADKQTEKENFFHVYAVSLLAASFHGSVYFRAVFRTRPSI